VQGEAESLEDRIQTLLAAEELLTRMKWRLARADEFLTASAAAKDLGAAQRKAAFEALAGLSLEICGSHPDLGAPAGSEHHTATLELLATALANLESGDRDPILDVEPLTAKPRPFAFEVSCGHLVAISRRRQRIEPGLTLKAAREWTAKVVTEAKTPAHGQVSAKRLEVFDQDFGPNPAKRDSPGHLAFEHTDHFYNLVTANGQMPTVETLRKDAVAAAAAPCGSGRARPTNLVRR